MDTTAVLKCTCYLVYTHEAQVVFHQHPTEPPLHLSLFIRALKFHSDNIANKYFNCARSTSQQLLPRNQNTNGYPQRKPPLNQEAQLSNLDSRGVGGYMCRSPSSEACFLVISSKLCLVSFYLSCRPLQVTRVLGCRKFGFSIHCFTHLDLLALLHRRLSLMHVPLIINPLQEIKQGKTGKQEQAFYPSSGQSPQDSVPAFIATFCLAQPLDCNTKRFSWGASALNVTSGRFPEAAISRQQTSSAAVGSATPPVSGICR
ncbi:hypothetical protein V8C42DRAFT_317758 [Trichoderma barbatum]